MTISNFINSINTIKKEQNFYQKWDEDWNDFESKRKVLYDKVSVPQEEMDRARKFGTTIDNIVEKLDENSENTAQNIESVMSPASSVLPFAILMSGGYGFLRTANKWSDRAAGITDPEVLQNINKQYMRKLKGIATVVPISMLAVGVASAVISSKLQISGLKISHYQSQEDLKDPRNFVLYDDDQVEKAKKLVKAGSIPNNENENTKFKSGFFSNLFSLIHDYKDYEGWESNQQYDISIANPNPKHDELLKAKKDQSAILRSVKVINEKADEYSENMESSAGTLLNSSLVGGAAIGYFSDKLLEKVQIGKKSLPDHFVDKLINSRITDAFGPYKDVFNTVLQQKSTRKTLMGVLSGFVAGILTIPISLKLKRQSTRIGRFAARKELEEDPKNCIYYDDKLIELAQSEKSQVKKKGVVQRIIDDFKFIPRAYRESVEYSKYKKTEREESKKLQNALKYVDIKPGQIEEAKNLQKKIFLAFKKVDEKSQEYSENMEAFTNSIQTAMPFLLVGALMIPGYSTLKKINAGEIHSGNVMEKLNKVKGAGVLGIALKFAGFYALNSYLASLELNAGQIGVMKAMEELKDPRYFVDKFSYNSEKIQDNKQSDKLLISQQQGSKNPKNSLLDPMNSWINSLNNQDI